MPYPSAIQTGQYASGPVCEYPDEAMMCMPEEAEAKYAECLDSFVLSPHPSLINHQAVIRRKSLHSSPLQTSDKIALGGIIGGGIFLGGPIGWAIALLGALACRSVEDVGSAREEDFFDGNGATSPVNCADCRRNGRSVPVLPAGAILPYGGTSAPDEYLMCDGTSYLRTSYSALFAVIGTAYGAADETHFNVPDMRGYFLRGVDGEAGHDPNSTARTANNTGGNTGNNVGSVQVEGTKTPTAPFTTALNSAALTGSTNTGGAHTHSFTALAGDTGFGNAANWIAQPDQPYQTTGSAGDHSHSISGSLESGAGTVNGGGDDETRPVNIYVNYIIKI